MEAVSLLEVRVAVWSLDGGRYTGQVRESTRSIAMLALALLLPIIPFILFGERLEAWFVGWTREEVSPIAAAAFVLLTLTSDILLPIPSSVICTFSGDRLGIVLGTICNWAGMMLGSTLGYGLAYAFGTRFLARTSDAETVSRMSAVARKLGPFLVVLTRAVPVLAEATILWLGAQRVPLRRIILPLTLSNLGISLGYAFFGKIAGDQGWLTIAMAIAAALPLLLWLSVQKWLSKLDPETESP